MHKVSTKFEKFLGKIASKSGYVIKAAVIEDKSRNVSRLETSRVVNNFNKSRLSRTAWPFITPFSMKRRFIIAGACEGIPERGKENGDHIRNVRVPESRRRQRGVNFSPAEVLTGVLHNWRHCFRPGPGG